MLTRHRLDGPAATKMLRAKVPYLIEKSVA
jgi:hypothetical protein